VVMDELVPMGQVESQRLLTQARVGGADALLVSLVGRDGITFQKAVNEMGVGERFVRLSTALDENCLVAAGGDTSGMLYSAMPSFILQPDERHQQLLESYLRRFGTTSPLPGSYAEGCYHGVALVAALWASGFLDSARTEIGAGGWSAGAGRARGALGRGALARAELHELAVIDLPGRV
jgi:urea transport system substrate-binding protein